MPNASPDPSHGGTVDPVEQLGEEGRLSGPPTTTWRAAGGGCSAARPAIAGLVIIGFWCWWRSSPR